MSALSNRIRIYIVVSLLLPAISGFGQRHIKGQVGLTPTLGLMDRIPTRTALRQNQQGYSLGLDFVRYTKNGSYWKVGYSYDVKYYAGPMDSAPHGFYQSSRHFVSWDYVPKFIHNRQHSLYISPTIGLNTGYEIINNNQRNVPEGRIQTHSSGLFGIQLGVESEFYLAERTALVIAVQERFLPFSDLSKLHTYGTLGLRFTFFTD